MIALIISFLLVILLLLGTPIAFALAISGAAGLLWVGDINAVLGVLSSVPRESATVYEFMTIPMFLLMAEFVLRSGIGEDLFKSAAVWVGKVPGGLGIATAISGAGFGAICGSSTAAAATLSSTSLSVMRARGYEPHVAAGVVSISGTLAMLIPPSIAMILYGLLTGVSIAKLLVAGVIPGLLVTFTIVLTVYGIAKLYPHLVPSGEKATLKEKFQSLKPVWPMLVLLFAVTISIYAGIATPTEASAVGALCAGLLYLWKERPARSELYAVIARAIRTSCMLAFILMAAHIFSTFFTYTQTTQGLIEWVGGLAIEGWVIILVLVLLYIILGCFLDQAAILVLTVPIVAPLVESLGFDLIWFGVIMIVTAELGLVTPPLGLNCFVVSKYSGMPVTEVFRGVLPHVLMHLVAIGILMLFPALTLWLPNQMS